ncbi:hypothetical protein JBE27_54260 [Streptomyces albiflaviniger]|nr:hypothetical protein [Streptomyces albiflaviniger]
MPEEDEPLGDIPGEEEDPEEVIFEPEDLVSQAMTVDPEELFADTPAHLQ